MTAPLKLVPAPPKSVPSTACLNCLGEGEALSEETIENELCTECNGTGLSLEALVRSLVGRAPRCGALDRFGKSCCHKTGTHGPSQKYLQSMRHRLVEQVDLAVYCSVHAKSNPYGREGDDNFPLPYSEIVNRFEK